MNPRRLSTAPTPLLQSVIFAIGFVGLLATSGLEGIQHTGAAPRTDISALSYSIKQELAGARQQGSMLNNDLGQIHGAMAALSFPGAVADASIALPESRVETAPPDMPPTEPAPVQVAIANPSDFELGDANKTVTSIEIVDECVVVDICIDLYLWTLYQRTPKEDTIKKLERRNVAIKRKGKMVTVARVFTKLVDEDFGWKDPKSAERAGMSMMDYVIGGMDRSFKLKLFHTLHAAEAAGLSPGITSAFRDDYRQSIASGLKAASNRSYHGGSSRGGYGHGLAADIVSVRGGTRDHYLTERKSVVRMAAPYSLRRRTSSPRLHGACLPSAPMRQIEGLHEGCPYRKSNPGILMMQSAQDRMADNASSCLVGA